MEGDVEIDAVSSNCDFETEEGSLPAIQLLPAAGNITTAIIEQLETDLDFQEKVSMVFLLYENVDLALQRLKAESYLTQREESESLPQCGLLSDWARSRSIEHSPDWEEKFLEALCIIQNFYTIERLGYNIDEVAVRFLPENPETAVNVNLTRKALYIFCEKLAKTEEIRLIELVEQEIGHNKTPSFIRNDMKCMETFLLYLMSRKYIFCQNGVTIITKHLKAMGESRLHDFLESVGSCHDRLSLEEELLSDDDISLAESRNAQSIVSNSNISGSSCVSSEIYHINSNNIGVCVIINQKNFYRDCNPKFEELMPTHDLENRIGTDVDRDGLQEAFGNYGFTIQLWENLTHIDLIKSITYATENIVREDHSCFVLCILSHGQRGTVYGVNSIPVEIDDIHRKIQGKSCPKLINKPKIIIIQACQGDEYQEVVSSRPQMAGDLDSDGPCNLKGPSVPEITDSLIFTSTLPGFVSYRDRISGSWFIQSLCRQLLSPKLGTSITDACLRVNNDVQKLHAGGKAMQPVFSVTLKANPFFPCNLGARKKVAKLMIKRMVFKELLQEYLSREYHRKNNILGYKS